MRLTRVRIARRKIRRIGLHHRTFLAVIGGILAVVPAVAASGGAQNWVEQVSTQHSRNIGLVQGFNPKAVHVSVDGTLPQATLPADLPLTASELPAAYVLPGGLLGIPGTALKAYRNAAAILAQEQPNCHIDWALIASIGRIESNHARGGYVDKNGKTLEPILGPELDGVGGFAAIPDTDHGFYDLDTVWDRAVGPTQFIPSTWRAYASDGNGDGIADPNNIYDETVATGRFLCAGGGDLANPDQERAAIYRYNNSDTYVAIVLAWADAYRNGVLPLPDSTVPIGAPSAPALPPPASVPSSAVPSTPAPPPVTSSVSQPPPSSGSSTPPRSLPPLPSTSTVPPSTTTTTPTCLSTSPPPSTSQPPTSPESPSPTSTPTSPTLPPCAPPPPPPPPSGGTPTTTSDSVPTS
ncbi:MAG TPA: lytic murein transglycosylase [Amycolatopsis sp.]|nr:lytic murein transglycosylase [Amycolatopsis sp.]